MTHGYEFFEYAFVNIDFFDDYGFLDSYDDSLLLDEYTDFDTGDYEIYSQEEDWF